jgi:hypothetical protein
MASRCHGLVPLDPPADVVGVLGGIVQGDADEPRVKV